MYKNRNIFCNLTLWDDIVGNLLYPAILGSLVYEFTNFRFAPKFLFMAITLVFYFVDYFYMHNEYKKFQKDSNEKKCRTRRMIISDFVVAALFVLMIFCINTIFSGTCNNNSDYLQSFNPYYLTILISALGVFIIANIYIQDTKSKNYVLIELVINSVIVIVFRSAILLCCCKCDSSQQWIFEAVIYSILVILYAKAVHKDYYMD